MGQTATEINKNNSKQADCQERGQPATNVAET